MSEALPHQQNENEQERKANRAKEEKTIAVSYLSKLALKSFILMNKMQNLLNSQKKKHLILGTKPEWIHLFAQKAQKCFDESWIQTIFLDHLIIEEINTSNKQGYLFFYCSSLRLFIKDVEMSALQKSLLKEVSLTFTEEIEEELNLSNVDLFCDCIYGGSGSCLSSSSIELKEQQLKKRMKVIDLMNLTKTALIDFLNHKKKKAIFNIFKSTSIRNLKMAKRIQVVKRKLNAKRKKKTFGANSLISISEEVRQFVKKCKRTTPLRTTNYIVDLLKRLKSMNPSKKGSILLKNIQRRVYDAINVLSALGIISKDKNIITYIGEDYYIDQSNGNGNSNSNSYIDQSIMEMKLTIEAKKHRLIQGLNELTVYDYFNRVNRFTPNKLNTTSKLSLPFNYVNSINQKSTSEFMNDYQCISNVLSLKENKEDIKSYDDLITKLSVNIRHSNGIGNTNSLSLSKQCLEYCEHLSEYQSQNVESTTIPIPLSIETKYDCKSAFDLDFGGFNSLDLSSNDYFYEDIQGSIKKNEYYFEPEACSPFFDLVMYENNQRS